MTAALIGRWFFVAAADNHEPYREQISGVMAQYERPDGQRMFRLPHAGGLFRDAYQSLYLLDDGETVVPHYVSGWNDRTGHPERGTVYLDPFPVNPGGRTVRADDPSRPVDYASWMLGPRRAYHLKINKES